MRRCTNIVRRIHPEWQALTLCTGKSLKDGAFKGAGKLSA
jgi:hypothetical protein